MPKELINTYATYNFMVDGKVHSAKVSKIVSEESYVKEVSKEVGVFEKYTAKKTIRAKINTSALQSQTDRAEGRC